MNKYYVNGICCEESDFWSKLEEEIDNYVGDHLDDFIDDDNEEIHIGSITISPSYALKKCDPIAYGCIKDDYIDMELGDMKYELEQDHYCSFGAFEFRIEETEEEEE